ncbi:unnamed protein product [Clonostachys solani]|uniref:Uncharacterized protein n=1 Tax=Clonostachys solani TaxID=160281 RepID=A0A9P0EAW6_9HYPO|nr:unnamed protein product [Clonostachys solani]
MAGVTGTFELVLRAIFLSINNELARDTCELGAPLEFRIGGPFQRLRTLSQAPVAQKTLQDTPRVDP